MKYKNDLHTYKWVFIPVLNFGRREIPSVQNHSLHLLILPSTPSSFQDLPVFLFPLLYSASSFLLALCSSSVSMRRSLQTLPLFFSGSFSAFVSLHSQTSKRHYLYNCLYCSVSRCFLGQSFSSVFNSSESPYSVCVLNVDEWIVNYAWLQLALLTPLLQRRDG